ncbi:hypothetical protein IP92_00378 [Pseudoduganella flava]|uniref:Peptidase M4 domain-containing protein n=1 Tax=Pseudoduganella flava TaxID=871742 RepID=A0A562Q3U2_9BURK|nr:hypothetical protein [Pseudoduganella flava]QGZ41438.1 hypothetical protein GO485_21825 [Pseudoduganella flava]TWI51393.1 hypothetical protein IP92_00378 [Pseudoduganella flava]
MDKKVIVPVEAVLTKCAELPVGFVPTPSAPYRTHRKAVELTQKPGRPRLKTAPGVPQRVPAATAGSRVLMWKQDPSVTEMGTRKAFLPGVILEGPRDARITFGQPGIAAVSPNTFGDFILSPNTDQFDAVHTFAVVRQTLTMYQRVLAAGDAAAPLPWAWNNGSNTQPLEVFPHGLPNVMNAYYSRTDRALKFGDFVPSGAEERMYTCRSFDIVSHETGHAVLDGLKPKWILSSAPPQTGGLHESFGDLTAIFLALSQLDQVEAVIAQTKADLHDKTFLADMAEQFGLALGRTNGLRNADNDLKLSEAGNEVHAISQVFTGAMYDILADIFTYERQPGMEDDAAVLHRVGGYLCSLLMRSLVAAPDMAATFADVANQMLRLAEQDGKPIEYRNFIRNRFTLREVVVSDVPLTDDVTPNVTLAPAVVDEPDAMQDRRACCGTMNHAQYFDLEDVLEAERQALARWCQGYKTRHDHTEPAASEELAVNK